MRGKRGEIGIGKLQRNLASSLGDVGVIQHTALAANRCEFGDRLNRPDLTVRRFDRDELRIRPDRIAQRGGIDEAFAVGSENGQLHAAFFRAARRSENRFVLDR